VARYTGQEDQKARDLIRETKPDILLTNFMMLELLMTRQKGDDRAVMANAEGLEFLVLDELHTYRGRQGADVAMLMRRVRDRLCPKTPPICIGTSATMSSEGDAGERAAAVAKVASKLFATHIPASSVIAETLERATLTSVDITATSLASAIDAFSPTGLTDAAMAAHPLAAWIEMSVGLKDEQGLAQRTPMTLRDAAHLLSKAADRPVPRCSEVLKELLTVAGKPEHERGGNGDGAFLAFKLHRFISGAGHAHATLRGPETRKGRSGWAVASRSTAPLPQERSPLQRRAGSRNPVNHGLHFISGLPRAGSTLLSALLRQNPHVHAAMTSPVGSLVTALLRGMSQENEGAVFIDDDQRARILIAAVDAFYAEIHPDKVVIDTNRLWCSKLPTIAALWPDAKVIACVRNPAWCLDSIESLTRRNALEPSGIFKFDPGGTVYSRAKGLMSGTGMIGYALNALREAVFGAERGRLLLVRFETLTVDPARVLAAIYGFLGVPPFTHDLEHIEPDYDAMMFDARLGTPGLHAVGPRVSIVKRDTILPPDLFAKYTGDAFWDAPLGLPESVQLV